MDKFTRNFFDSILNDGGSPVYSTAPEKIKSSFDIKESVKKMGSYFSKKAPTVKPAAETKLPMVTAEEPVSPKSEPQLEKVQSEKKSPEDL